MQQYESLYRSLDFRLVAIASKSKSPVNPGWNKSKKPDSIKPKQNIGVKLSYSGLCCFDIDDLKMAKKVGGKVFKLLRKEGLCWTSGKKNRLKILFRVPVGVKAKKLGSFKLSHGIGEFRCASAAGKTMQDLLPPSRHPEGTIYKWIDSLPSDRDLIPVLPDAIFKNEMFRSAHGRAGGGRAGGKRDNKYKAPFVDVFNRWAIRAGYSIEDEIRRCGGYEMVFGGFRRIGSSNKMAIKVYSSSDAFNFSTTDEQPIPHGVFDIYDMMVINKFKGDKRKAYHWVTTHKEMVESIDLVYDKERRKRWAKR